ncbi:CP family cyanate transporter-like MFS transporter [Kushneria sinocarnis]|uniref:CP family cyanate transporter-like MFS transporter n=1 Tax=Kushneria sinocarnis TaxID=595502 RepID=A0A420X0J8_9GAMM|nr:MFS transporter [Kushneria sinocarnis]RKR07376.1 CP family cyanate transporter-like MFS transporter [Kushneria sinocarnis]
MTAGSTSHQHTARYLSLHVLIMWVGLNLRPSIAAVGPLLDRIQQSLAMSYSQASLLTALPFVAMGLACFQGMRLVRRFDRHRLIMLALGVITLASLMRLFTDSLTGLALTALAGGAGIAVIQALMPALIKATLPDRVSSATGLYIGAILGGGALASMLAPPLTRLTGSWHVGLAAWALLGPLALWQWQRHGGAMLSPVPREGRGNNTPLHRLPRAWSLTLFFGFGTAGYACVLAWLPPYYLARGWSASAVGALLGHATLLQVLASVALPWLMRYRLDRRPALYAVVGAALVGFIGLLAAPAGALAWLWATLLGVGIGGVFPLSVLVPMDHHRDPARAGDLAAFVQGHGYLIAAAGTLAAAVARDLLAGFEPAWLALIVLFGWMLVISRRFDPAHYTRQID